MNPKFPFNSITLQRLLCAADDAQRLTLLEIFLPAIWHDGVDVTDAAVIGEVLDKAGLDAEQMFAKTQDPAVKQMLMDNTEQAVERGAFGIPTFFVGNEMFFGKERLGQIEEMLAEG